MSACRNRLKGLPHRILLASAVPSEEKSIYPRHLLEIYLLSNHIRRSSFSQTVEQLRGLESLESLDISSLLDGALMLC